MNLPGVVVGVVVVVEEAVEAVETEAVMEEVGWLTVESRTLIIFLIEKLTDLPVVVVLVLVMGGEEEDTGREGTETVIVDDSDAAVEEENSMITCTFGGSIILPKGAARPQCSSSLLARKFSWTSLKHWISLFHE